MRGEWCYFHQNFSKETCEKILELGLQIEPQDAKLGVSGMSENSNSDYRRSKVRFIQSNNPDFQFLFDELWRMCIAANKEWFNFNITNVSYVQLAEYDSAYEGEYKKHHDVFYMSGNEFHRKLTCVVQLSNPLEYEGGNLELYDLNEYPDVEEIKKQGTAIFFPSFTTHAALPVTKGKRYSLAVWYEGPHWV